jgi:hypothetical protein
MKLLCRLGPGAILFCGLLLAPDSLARLPGPYHAQAFIVSIDYAASVLVVAGPPRKKFILGRIVRPTTFRWTQETVFTKDGRSVNAAALAPGEKAWLYYQYSSRKQPPNLVKVLWSGTNRPRRYRSRAWVGTTLCTLCLTVREVFCGGLDAPPKYCKNSVPNPIRCN